MLVGWAVAAWQMSMGFGIGLSFGYLMLLLVAVGVVGWLVAGRPRLPRGVLAADLAGGADFAAVTLGLGGVLLDLAEKFPESTAFRGEEFLRWFSPPLRALWTADEHALLWGPLTAGSRAGFGWPIELCLFPGLVLVVLAVLGLAVSEWSRRVRLWLALAVAATVIASLGTTVAGGVLTWLPARHVLPGVEAMRTPGRRMLYAVLGLGLLAAGAVTRLCRSALLSRATLRPVILALPLLVCVEGLSTVPHPRVPPPPSALALVRGPVLILPGERGRDPLSLLWSTAGFYRQVNGYGAFTPKRVKKTLWMVQWFPDQMSIDYLRSEGIREVVIVPDRAVGTPFAIAADRPVDGLPVSRRDLGDSVLFALH